MAVHGPRELCQSELGQVHVEASCKCSWHTRSDSVQTCADVAGVLYVSRYSMCRCRAGAEQALDPARTMWGLPCSSWRLHNDTANSSGQVAKF
jgi:hypothetical protein